MTKDEQLRIVADWLRSIAAPDNPPPAEATDIEIARYFCEEYGAKLTDDDIVAVINSLVDGWPEDEIAKSAGGAFCDYIDELGRYDRPSMEQLKEMWDKRGLGWV